MTLTEDTRSIADIRDEIKAMDKRLSELGFTKVEEFKTEREKRLNNREEYTNIKTKVEIKNNRAKGFDAIINLFNVFKQGLPLTSEYVVSSIMRTNLFAASLTNEESFAELDEVVKDVMISEEEKENFDKFVSLLKTGLGEELKVREQEMRLEMDVTLETARHFVEQAEKRKAAKENIRLLNKGQSKPKGKK